MKDNRWKQLSAILDEVEVYGRAIGKVDFDMQCVAPPEGLEQAGEDEAVLGKRIHALRRLATWQREAAEAPGSVRPIVVVAGVRAALQPLRQGLRLARQLRIDSRAAEEQRPRRPAARCSVSWGKGCTNACGSAFPPATGAPASARRYPGRARGI